MSNCASDYAFSNQEQCFAVAEASCGVLTKPAGTNAIYTVGPGDFTQDRELLTDEQVRQYASKLASIKGRLMVGDWSFASYVKPYGTAGQAPEHDILYQCLMGTKTPGGTVVYSLANQLDSFSLWYKKGHTVFAFRGCTVEKADFSVDGQALSQVKWSGKFMERLWAGEAKTTGTYSIGNTVLTFVATGALRYCPGMYVMVGADDNAGNGYQILSVNYTTDQITLASALLTNVGATPTVYPWLPTAGTEHGTPQNGKMGLVTIGAHNAIVLSATVSITNNIKYYDNQKNDVWTAEEFGRPGKRAISGNLQLYFLKSGLSYFYRSDYLITNALIIPIGNVAGSIVEIAIPYAEYRTPKISGNEEFLQDVPFEAIASAAGNDECSIVFK